MTSIFTLMGEISLRDDEYKAKLASAERGTKQAGQGMERAIDRSASNMEARLNRLGQGMQRAGTMLTIGITTPLTALGVTFIRAASDAEETASKFAVVFQSVGAEAESTADRLSASFGLSSTNARKLLGDTGDLLTGFGFTGEAALDLSTQVNELAVDLASFTNFSGGAAGASAALTKALLGERESVKSLGISILDTDVQARVLLNTQRGMTFETERQAKAWATLQIAQEQSKNAIGDFARTSDSFANQMRILGARVNDLSVAFGEVMLPVVTKIVTVVASAMEHFMGLDDGMKVVIVTVGLVAASLGPLLVGLGAVLRMTPLLVSGFTALRTVMLSVPFLALAVAVSVLYEAWKRDWFGIQEYTRTAVAFIGERINAIAGFGRSLIRNWETVQWGWSEILTSMASAAGGASDVIAGAFQRVPATVQNAFITMAHAVQEVFTSVTNGIIRTVNLMIDGLGSVGVEMNRLSLVSSSAWVEGAASMEAANDRVIAGQERIATEFRNIQSVVGSVISVLTREMEAGATVVEAVAAVARDTGVDLDEMFGGAISDATSFASLLKDVEKSVNDVAAAITRMPSVMPIAASASYLAQQRALVEGGAPASDGWSAIPRPSASAASIRSIPQPDVSVSVNRVAQFLGVAAANAERMRQALGIGADTAQAQSEAAETARLESVRAWREQMEVNAELQRQANTIRTDTDAAQALAQALRAIPVPGVSAAIDQEAQLAALREREIAQRWEAFEAWNANAQAMRALSSDAGVLGSDMKFAGEAVDEEVAARQESIAAITREATSRDFTAQAMWTGGEAASVFGLSVLDVASRQVPALGAALDGFARGGPLGALAGVFSTLLTQSEGFSNLMGAINTLLSPIVNLLGLFAQGIANVINWFARLFGIRNEAERKDDPADPNSLAHAREQLALGRRELELAATQEERDNWLRFIEIFEGIIKEKLGDVEDALREPERRGIEEVNLSRTPQGYQLAVATPLVEAVMMFKNVIDQLMPSGQALGLNALPPFTTALDKHTPVMDRMTIMMDRLLTEGVRINVNQSTTTTARGNSTASLRGI